MKIPMIHIFLEYTLKLVGLWPDQVNVIGIILTGSSLFSMLPFQFWEVTRLTHDPTLFIDNVSQVVAETLLYLKIIVFWINGRNIKNIIRDMANYWKVNELTENWQKLFLKAHRFCVFDYLMYFGTSCMFYVQMFSLYFVIPVEQRFLMLRAYYPFDYKMSPIYEIMNFIQLVQGLVMCCIQALSETLIMAFALHICGVIDTLFTEIEIFSKNCSDNENCFEDLMMLIKNHSKILKLVNKVDAIYTYVSLIQVFLVTIIMCAVGFVILTVGDIIIIIKFSMFYVTLVWQIYSFCYAGQNLINKSEQIPNALYSIEWYNIKPKYVKLLVLMIKRSQSPLKLTAGKFANVSATTFASVIKTSFSYLSVLRATYA